MTRFLRMAAAAVLLVMIMPISTSAQPATPSIESPGWWTSWSTCEMTPIRSTPWDDVS